MHTREADGRGLGAAAKNVADHVRSLVRLELELATLEVRKKLAKLGTGIGLLVGAALVGVFALAFLLATVAAAFATFLATWLALLVTAVLLLVLAAGLAAVGVRLLRQGTPPVPAQAMTEAKRTREAIRSNGSD